MTTIVRVREPDFVLLYNQRDISRDVTEYVTQISFDDYLTGQSDSIEIELEDRDGRWRSSWYPGKGDTLELRLGYAGALINCGLFEIDELEVSLAPDTVSLRALSTGVQPSWRTRRTEAFEDMPLRKLVETVAGRHGFSVEGNILDLTIDRITQHQERDIEFLNRIAEDYGHAFRLLGKRLVFTHFERLRAQAPALRFKPTDLKPGTSFRDTIRGVYSAARHTFHDAKSRKLSIIDISTGVVTAGDTGTEASGDLLRLSSRGTDDMRKAKARAAIERDNMEQTNGRLVLEGHSALVAGICISLEQFGKLSGKYLVYSAHHRIARRGGYATTASVKRVSAGAQE